MERDDPVAARFRDAVEGGDARGLRRLFAQHEALTDLIDEPWFSFGGRALGEAAARGHREVVDALLDLGADIDARSEWENGPYSALHRLVDGATPERLSLADHLVDRGATVDLHAAAGMGRMDVLRELLDADPDLVNQPGPDGATALHLAKDAEVASFLIGRGADVDQRCIDHRSTPAMWAVGGRLDVVRVLLENGATPDLFLAAVFDDVEMAHAMLKEDPTAIDVRVRFGRSHEHVGFGDKYVWTLGGAQTPIELARRRGSEGVYQYLLERSSPGVRVVQAALRGDIDALRDALAEDPGLIDDDRGHGPLLCQALCGSAAAAALLLDFGVDPNLRDDEAGATPLHHAAWRDLPDVAHILLDGGADPYLRDRSYDATPLGWANEAGNDAMMELLVERAPPDLVDSAWLGDADRVRSILRLDPSLADGFDGGRISALRSAAWTGRTDVVRALIDFGANPSLAHPETGKTALDYATERGHAEIVAILSTHS